MISVLLVDDEPVLLDIGRMFLERSGEFRVGEADSGRGALEKLDSESYDAIVADYEMPGMDGLALLRKVRESWPNLPFILFTGRGREEVVIEALNSGADYYLQKGGDPKAQFTELAHKIKQAVVTRKASSELKENEETFRQFFNAAGDAIIILDGDRIVDCNKKALDILKRDRDQVIGENPDIFLHPNQPGEKNAREYLHEILDMRSTNDSHLYEWRIIRSDQSWIVTEVTISWITIRGRNLLHAIIRDISSRKKQEEASRINEIRLRAMLDLFTMRDNTLKDITDFSLEQALLITGSQHGYLAFINDDESLLTMYSWSGLKERGTRQEKPVTYEIRNTGHWGSVIKTRQPSISNRYKMETGEKEELPNEYHPIHRHMCVPIFDRDRIVLLAGVLNKEDFYSEEDVHQLTLLMSGMWGIVRRKKTEDILHRKNAELLVAYDQLRTIEKELNEKYEDIRLRSAELTESEERFRRLSDLAPVFIMIGDEKGHIIYINNRWRELFGNPQTSPDESWNGALYPEDKERIKHSYQDLILKQQPFSEEFRIIGQNSEIFWIRSTVIPRITPDRRLLGYMDVSVDITDRKLIEQALEECEKRFQSVSGEAKTISP